MKKYIKQIISLIIIVLIIIGYVIFNKKQNVNKVYPSVVRIECKNDKTTTIGSGIVYDIRNSNYYIVTSYHIIKGYSIINVQDENLNTKTATILNYDEDNDIAILLVDEKLAVKKATFDLNKKLKKEDNVYIFTSYMDENNSYIIKEGTIFSEKENIKLNNISFNTIVINTNIEKGDSGSPLIDTKGKVIGMMFLKDKENENIGYALPIDFIFEKIEKLEKRNNNINLGALMTSSDNKSLIDEYGIELSDNKGVVLLSVKIDYPL